MARPSLRAMQLAFPEMSFRLVDGEYRVNFKRGAEATAYYTNDAQDAIDTARVMLATRPSALDRAISLRRNPSSRKRATRKRAARRRVHVRRRVQRSRKNPPIYTGSKRGLKDASHMIGLHVYEIRYSHAADGRDYKHPFDSDVMMLGMPDGSLRIESATGKKLWANFDV